MYSKIERFVKRKWHLCFNIIYKWQWISWIYGRNQNTSDRKEDHFKIEYKMLPKKLKLTKIYGLLRNPVILEVFFSKFLDDISAKGNSKMMSLAREEWLLKKTLNNTRNILHISNEKVNLGLVTS